MLVEASFIYSRLTRKAILAGMPWAASIEPTAYCNLGCTECPTGKRSLTRPSGNLDLAVFRKMLDQLSPNLLYLTLYFQGEPLMNPKFSEMVGLARERHIFISTSTNGHFLNDMNIGQMIKSGLNHLIISLDGLDQQAYEKYRVHGKLHTVIEGIHRLVAAKKASRTAFPLIELQFLVMAHNQHQMKQMKAFAKKVGVDRLTFKSVQVYNFDAESTIIPSMKGKSRYRQNPDGSWKMAGKLRNRCHRLWSSLVVTWDGRVVPCCYDKNAGQQTGNIFEEPLSAIWKNQLYTSFRKKVLYNRSEIEICRNCGE